MQFTLNEQFLLIEAFFALFVSFVAVRYVPFRSLSTWLGRQDIESSSNISDLHDDIAKNIGWAVEIVSRNAPWKSRCLAQAISAWWMLFHRGIVGTIYIGVAPNEPGKLFNAHAWIRCGNRIVTGGSNQENFRVLSSFTRAKP